ncbi:MAG: hypothetical protein V7731_17535 [Amphritea sp.]
MADNVEISDQQLISLAGKGAFSRGKDYFQQGLVNSWQKKGDVITADVEGSELYRVTLIHNSRRFEGSCDCPASEGFDFCKHCVAVAMVYRQEFNQQVQLMDGNAEQRIQAYLNKFDKQGLAEQLLAIIVSDNSLKQQWSIKADIALNKIDVKALKKRITAAIPFNRSLYRYAQVRSYFSKVEPIVDLLEGQLPQLDNEKALNLVDYALQRLSRALETIDDSGGFRLEVEEQLQRMHYSLLENLAWDKPKLVEYLLAIDTAPYSDMYSGVPNAYTELLGDEGMTLIYEDYQRQWDALPPLPEGAGWEDKSAYRHLQYLLQKKAEDKGDGAAVIALLKKTATDESDFLELCKLCLEQGDVLQAETWLARAKRLVKSGQKLRYSNLRVERMEITLLCVQEKYQEALQLQWAIYQQSLSIDDYQALLTFAEKSCSDKNFYGKAENYLRSRLTQKNAHSFFSNDADALVALYLNEKQNQSALDVVKQYQVNESTLLRVAKMFSAQPSIAMPIYFQLADSHVLKGNNDAYHQAVSLLSEAALLIVNAEHKQLFEDTLEGFRTRHKAKRNFIKYLKEAFHEKG